MIETSGYMWYRVVENGCFDGKVQMPMFMGEYNHTIDAKGRLIVPSRLREALGEEFVITKGLDGCLFAYPKEEWAVLEEKLGSLPLTNSDARRFSRFFLAGAAVAEVDKQGRILIPPVLRAFAALEKEAVFVGVAKRVEIWSRERWEKANSFDNMEEIAEHMEDLGL